MIPKLEVSGVSYSYHSLDGETLALSDISFTVDTGEFLAIVGPSGCGKSTLLTMLCGLTTPDSGAILLDGKPLTRDASAISPFFRERIFDTFISIPDKQSFIHSCGIWIISISGTFSLLAAAI